MLSRTAEPTVAERVRTVCARASGARVVGEMVASAPCPVAHLQQDGSFVLSVPDRAVTGLVADAPAVLELLDYPPGAPGQWVRALVWVRGRLRPVADDRRLLDSVAAADPNPALLDVGHGHRLVVLHVESLVFADATGAETVDRATVLDASPDPFCHTESAWVRHLGDHHPELVERLRLHLPRPMRRGRLRLLGLDRYGLQLRTVTDEGSWEVRVPFFAPVADDAALRRALRLLIGCPFNNALRTRPSPR